MIGDAQIVIVMDGIDPASTTLNVTVTQNPFFPKFKDLVKDRPSELILDVSFTFLAPDHVWLRFNLLWLD